MFINIGFKNYIAAKRVSSVVAPNSAPIKRMIADAREIGMLVDATYGRRTRSVIGMDSNHVVLSSVDPETINKRAKGVVNDQD